MIKLLTALVAFIALIAVIGVMALLLGAAISAVSGSQWWRRRVATAAVSSVAIGPDIDTGTWKSGHRRCDDGSSDSDGRCGGDDD